MAVGLANQIVNSTPGMALVGIANRHPDKATAICVTVGVPSTRVSSVDGVRSAVRSGAVAVTDDAFLLCESDAIDVVVVEVTRAIRVQRRYRPAGDRIRQARGAHEG